MRAGALAVVIVAALLLPTVGSSGAAGARPAPPARYCVGAAKADITPPSVAGVYLGGYGLGPVHPATGVLRQIYSRAISIGDCHGHHAVIAADDLQGHFLAYQQGPYGFGDVQAAAGHQLGIPASDILIQSTHTHNGPDDLGIWGGVPTSYLALVADRTEQAVVRAVRSERPATLRFATVDMTGFSGTFGPNSPGSTVGDTADYPIDNQMRVLQAISPNGRVIATLLNYSSHATIYGPLNKVSPDWPGAAATYLEHDEIGMPHNHAYGYPGSIAVVSVGAVGHTWPASVPTHRGAATPPKRTDDNYPADQFGNAVAQQAVNALRKAQTFTGTATVASTSETLAVVSDNPVLLGLILLPVPGLHVYRSLSPSYLIGNVIETEAQQLRVGDLALVSAPGEPYPSIEKTLTAEVGARAVLPFGLADDQLGYVGQLDDYNGAIQCSFTDEGFFIVSPTFGNDLEAAQRANARTLGFTVHDPGPITDLNVGPIPPPTVCLIQDLMNPGSFVP